MGRTGANVSGSVSTNRWWYDNLQQTPSLLSHTTNVRKLTNTLSEVELESKTLFLDTVFSIALFTGYF